LCNFCVVCCRFQRGLKRKPLALIKKLRKAKKDAAQGEKPEAVRTHLRNMIIVPEMIGSVIGVYNGKTFNQVRQSAVCLRKCVDLAFLLFCHW
jgi:ribosomal protein uS19